LTALTGIPLAAVGWQSRAALTRLAGSLGTVLTGLLLILRPRIGLSLTTLCGVTGTVADPLAGLTGLSAPLILLLTVLDWLLTPGAGLERLGRVMLLLVPRLRLTRLGGFFAVLLLLPFLLAGLLL